jgi:hypothetical protein
MFLAASFTRKIVGRLALKSSKIFWISKPMTFEYTQKIPLCEDIVFVDGITRSGKKLTCKITSHFQGIDYFQYQSIAEHIAYAAFLDKIENSFGSALLQYQLEEHLYNRIIGRNLNTREEDETNVARSPDYQEYIRRGKRSGGELAVEQFKKEGRRGLFHIHSVMPAADILFHAFPKLTLIHVNRHPIDLSMAWIQHGWGEREISDPLAFGPIVQTDGNLVPWFASQWAEKYLSLNNTERAVESIIYLQKADQTGYNNLDASQKQHVYRFCLEHLTINPLDIVDQIGKLMLAKPRLELELFLTGSERPRVTSVQNRQQYFSKISHQISNDTLQHLVEFTNEYEKKWGLPTSV